MIYFVYTVQEQSKYIPWTSIVNKHFHLKSAIRLLQLSRIRVNKHKCNIVIGKTCLGENYLVTQVYNFKFYDTLPRILQSTIVLNS